MGLSCLERIEIFPPIAIVISHCGQETLVVQCVSIVLLSAELGSCTRGPLCFMGPSWNAYFSSTSSSSRSNSTSRSTRGPLSRTHPVFYGCARILPWEGPQPKEGLQEVRRPDPILLTSLSLNAICADSP